MQSGQARTQCCAANEDNDMRLREHIRLLVEERQQSKQTIARLTEALEKMTARLLEDS